MAGDAEPSSDADPEAGDAQAGSTGMTHRLGEPPRADGEGNAEEAMLTNLGAGDEGEHSCEGRSRRRRRQALDLVGKGSSSAAKKPHGATPVTFGCGPSAAAAVAGGREALVGGNLEVAAAVPPGSP